MKNAYLYPAKPVAPGTLVPPEMMKPVTSLRVKSVIAYPANGAQVDTGKRILVRGTAWSGDAGAIAGVDVSTDQGRSWKAARLSGEATQFGWRLWDFPWMPSKDGPYTVLARARDAGGDVQPIVPEWNPSGYLWNAVARVDLDAGQSPNAATASSSAAPLDAPSDFRRTCLVCHEDDVIRQQRLTRAQWDREINKMIGWGARVQPENRETLLDYLFRLAGPRR